MLLYKLLKYWKHQVVTCIKHEMHFNHIYNDISVLINVMLIMSKKFDICCSHLLLLLNLLNIQCKNRLFYKAGA